MCEALRAVYIGLTPQFTELDTNLKNLALWAYNPECTNPRK